MPLQTTTSTSAADSAQPTTPQSSTQAPPTPAPNVEHQLQALQRQIEALTTQNEALAARINQPDSLALSRDQLRPTTAPPSSTQAQASHNRLPPAPSDTSAPPAIPADPPRLDRADIKRLATSLEPGRVERWISNLVDTLEDYSREAAELLRMPAHLAQDALSRDEHLRRLDRWAARQALNTMDHDKPYVRLIFDTISEEAEAARRSCVRLFSLVRAQSSTSTGEAARVRIAQFEAREYFTASMDVTTFHLIAGDFRSDFSALPVERTSTRNALFRSFLDKLPSTLKAQKRQLEEKLLESEILDTPLPWKFEQLVQLVANYNVLAARETSNNATVNMTDASQRPKSSKPSTGKSAPSQPCPCCGKAGHYARDCPTTCSICKHRSCPGNYGKPCAVTASPFPTTVLNALGKPLPPPIKRILIKAHSAKVKPSPQSASANLCQAETNTSDNFWGDEPAEHAEINMLLANQPEYVDIEEAEAEAWLNEWRTIEVARANDRNVTLPLCHGTRELQEQAAHGNTTWRLALRLEGNLVGMTAAALITTRRKQTIRISQIYVVPEYRDQGIARDLVRRILARATAHGAQYMALGLGLREQRATITFWTSYGFCIAQDSRRQPTIDDDLIPIQPSFASYDSFSPAPECSHADASSSPSHQPHLVMLDGGSNVNLFSNPDVPLVGELQPSPPLHISGWHTSSAVSVTTFYKIGLQLRSSTGHQKIFNVNVAYIPQGRRDILSESAMWDLHAWSAAKEPDLQVRSPSASFPLRRANGVYFVEAIIVPPKQDDPPPQILSLSAKHDGPLALARLWAARFHANSDVLRRLLSAADGLGIDKLSANMAKAADQDVINRRSNARRTPSPQVVTKDLLPGELLVLDAFGPVAAQSVVDGAHYELEAVCAFTGYGYEQSSQSLTQTQWLTFIARILANEKSLGHRVKRLRFDRVPNLHASSFEAEVNQKFQVVVEFAAQHEGIGAAEQRNDTKQRFAEADLMRSERTQSYLIPARIYAGWRLNRRVAAGRTTTRYEMHTGRRPNFTDPVPYLFGMECSVLEDEHERGPKGAGCHPESMYKGRTSVGTFLGVRGHGYLIKLHRGPLVERRRLTPHNEQVLLLRGLPPSAVSVDAAVQTSDPRSSTQSAPADACSPADAAATLRPPPSGTPAGTRPPADACPPADAAVHFTRPPADAAATLHPPSFGGARPPADAAVHFPRPQPTDRDLPDSWRGPPSMRTRSQVRPLSESIIESHLACAPLSDIHNAYDDALYQFCPTLYDDCCVSAQQTLDEARARLAATIDVHTHRGTLECSKATADIVQVQTDAGIQEYHVPATHAQRERAPDAAEWKRADEAALTVVLNTPSRDGRRNVLVPITKPESLGQPLLPSVLQRRIKTDPVSKRLIKRKSRLCIAGNRQKAIQQATGTYQPRQVYADAADDLLIKMVIADSAGSTQRPAKKRVKIDIGNAYGRGCRKRPPAYMLLGKSLRREDESGVELCVELNTPHYGEEPSGDEWMSTLDVDTRAVGWQQAEAVPALYYFLIPGGGRATLIRVVDDILLTYPAEARSVAEKTIAMFNKFYDNDVSVCWDPDSFVGYAIIDDPVTGAVTLNMASHIEHAVRQYVPALLSDPPQRPSASLTRGESFQSLADSMRHTPATAPLLPSQTQVQRIVGALRYPEKVLPMLTLGLHRLSCVAQNPPPIANRVAELLLQLAYEHRFEGLTYGGESDLQAAGLDATLAYGVPEKERPPDDLAACGDATWSTGLQSHLDRQPPYLASSLATLDAHGREVASRDLYSVLLTFRGAAVLHQTKKLALLVDCSMAAEEVATSKAAEHVEYASQVARALGVAAEGPVAIATDNASNRQVAMRQGASNRSKHLLRRYWVLLQRVQAGEVHIVHVRDEANPADFLTKWVPAKKLRSSVAYVTGQAARRKGFVRSVILARRAGVQQ